jgi:hypothetical protein
MSRRILWVLAVVLLVGCGLAQLPALAAMDAAGADVLTFELMGTSARAEQVLAEWGEAGRAAAAEQLRWDVGFLVGYGLALWLMATAVGASRRVTLLGPLAAGADALENASLAVVLSGTTTQPWPALAATFAAVKFALLAAWVLGMVLTLVRRRRARSGDPAAAASGARPAH